MKRIRDDATYRAHIQSPEWRAFRRTVIEARGGRCEVCSSWSRLHLHHLTYERLGAELPSDVLVVCQECHEAFHGRYDTAMKRVRKERAALVDSYRSARREERQKAEQETKAASRRAMVQAVVSRWRSEDAEVIESRQPNPKVKRRPKVAA